MKLKSYFNPARDSNLVQTVQVRLASDAAPGAGFILLGDLTHEPVDDNASGMQKSDVSHVIYQHIQEQLYLQYSLQDMSKIKITNTGGFKLLSRAVVNQGQNRLGVGFETTISVRLEPSDATNDGVTFAISNLDLVTITQNTGNGTLKFKSKAKGEIFVRVRVKGTSFEQTIPYEFTEELPAAVPVDSIAIAPAVVTLTGAAPTQQLTLTVLPSAANDKSVTYVSSAPAIATVSATGLVTRVANGNAVITVTAKDGSGKSATRNVTVTA